MFPGGLRAPEQHVLKAVWLRVGNVDIVDGMPSAWSLVPYLPSCLR